MMECSAATSDLVSGIASSYSMKACTAERTMHLQHRVQVMAMSV